MHRRSATGTRATICEAEGRFFVRWFADDADAWRQILDDFKAAFPRHGDKNFHPATKEWSIPGYKRPALGAWLRANFALDAIQWLDDEDDDRQDAPQGPRTSGLDQAFATLHLLPTAPPEVVQAAHRALVKLHHPDHGGDHDRAVAVNTAIATIRARAS